MLRLAHRGDWRDAPENTLPAFRAALEVPACDGLEFDVRLSRRRRARRVHDVTLERVQGRPEPVERVQGRALGTSACPTLADVLAAVPHRGLPGRGTEGRHGRAVVEVLAAGRGPASRNAVVSSFETATSSVSPASSRHWPRWLNAHDLDRYDRRPRAVLRVSRRLRRVARDRCGSIAGASACRRARGRRLDRAPPGDRPTRLAPASGLHSTDALGPCDRDAPRSTRAADLSCADGTRRSRGRRHARIEPISWSSGRGRSVAGPRSSPAEAGVGRVVVVERGLAGMGASSRAAGIVRAQGGTPATVALGRWSIDFYHGQPAAYGTDSGFRELGYLILAVTEEDERARARAGRDAAAPHGLDVRWLDADGGGRDGPRPSPPTGHRGGSYSRRDGCIDPPRNVRAYSLAMQAAGVELRERTAFTGLRTDADGGAA